MFLSKQTNALILSASNFIENEPLFVQIEPVKG